MFAVRSLARSIHTVAPHLAVVLIAAIAPARAAGPPRDVDGITLGMTTEQVIRSSHADCRPNKLSDVSCEDARTHDTYKVMMSGGKPSVAIAVKHTFCSTLPGPAILGRLLKTYGLGKAAARPNPNGTSFDVTSDVQGNLVTNGGSCPTGGSLYQFTLRDDGLMRLQGSAASGVQPATP